MNFFDNTVNEPNLVDFWVIIEFFILGLYTFTYEYLLDMLWHKNING